MNTIARIATLLLGAFLAFPGRADPLPRFPPAAVWHQDVVITSYSIHYTKLYEALDFVCSVYAQAGDTILVEEPSYFLAFRIFEDRGLKIVSVPTDQDRITSYNVCYTKLLRAISQSRIEFGRRNSGMP